MFNGKNTTIVPIYGVGERIGTLIVAKYDEEFTDDDLLLCEYGATVVGMEMLRDHAEKIEIEARKKATVQIAINTLSFSERKAAFAILSALDSTEGLLVASKIADQVKITRSVIVNALRKFESAGVISSKSLGMKVPISRSSMSTCSMKYRSSATSKSCKKKTLPQLDDEAAVFYFSKRFPGRQACDNCLNSSSFCRAAPEAIT